MHSVTDQLVDSPWWSWGLVVLYAFVRVGGEVTREARLRRAALRKRTQPWWLIVCWVSGGLAFNWWCGYEWFAGNLATYSLDVLFRTAVIALWCAGAALLVVYLTPKATQRDAGAAFFIASFFVFWILSEHWVGRR